MLHSLGAAITNTPELEKHVFVLGAGTSGVKAFQKPAQPGITNILLTWQWLSGMESLPPQTMVVMPNHAVDSRVRNLKNIAVLTIEGVLHTITPAKIAKENTSLIPENPQQIVILGGDAQQEDGSWKRYTPIMAEDLLSNLPIKLTLILNGPRTGKHEDDGKVDEGAHRTSTDSVTAKVQELSQNKPFTVVDFKYGAPSLWAPALQFCITYPETVLILAGESTSMISEAQGVGLRPSIFLHNAMTNTSRRYVEELVKQGKATLYPELPKLGERLQPPVPPQENVIVQELIQRAQQKQ